jgi:hypothetical protein
MSARTLRYDTGLLALFREVFYTLAQIGEEPLAGAYLPIFQKERDDLQALLVQELGLLEQLAKAQAAVDRADARLDRFALRVSHLVDDSTAGATRDQLRKKLFKGKSVSKFPLFTDTGAS